MSSGSERPELVHGGKIIMPPSALCEMFEMDLNWPLHFRLVNPYHSEEPATHCSVLEFTAEEGRVYLPQWMMETLETDEGDVIELETTELPLGEFVKIQPQHVDFLDIDDPKIALEDAMKNFSALTVGDNLSFERGGKVYNILVLETRPEGGVSLIDTDLEVDFAPPVGYVEPSRLGGIEDYIIPECDLGQAFAPFTGAAQRLNGTAVTAASNCSTTKLPAALRLPPGRLFFGYPIIPMDKKDK